MSTEGNRPEKALTSSEQELRLLVEAIPALVWRAGPEGNIEYVNKRVLDYLGAPLDEVIGWGWMDKVHPDDVAFKVRTWLQNLESGKPHNAVCRFRGADGRYRWFAVRGEPLRASDGGVLGWCGVLIDIDDRRKAQEALRESEYKLRQIIDTEPGLIWSTGPEVNRPMSVSAFSTTAVCDLKILSTVAGRHWCTRTTFHKLQRPTITQFRAELRTMVSSVYAERTASFVGTMLVVSLCAIGGDASFSGMACLLRSMKHSCKPL